MKKYLQYLGRVVVFAIFILAIYLLYNKLKAYSIAEIRESIQQISWRRIGFSMALMVINYIILVGYDWLALKAIHKKLSISRVSLVSFIGQAVSYNFGALLGGTTVRYRFYSAWGFTLVEIVRLVIMLAVTFWVGALGLCGIIFVVSPPHIPDALLAGMPIKDVRILGVILSCIAFSYLALCFSIRKPVHLFGKDFEFPIPGIAIAQCLVAGIDLIAAAACMYALLPSHIGISFTQFLPSYLMAQVAVVLTHIPGGVGIFELVILELTHTPEEQTVFAAVLLFRLIYYILPLLAAAFLLAIYEARQKTHMLRSTGRWLSVLSHIIVSYLVFIGGLILLVSSTLPTDFKNLPDFMAELPKFVLGIGHMICALSGAVLLFVSYGLERRQRVAFRMSVSFLIMGICGALLKGFSWQVAIMGAIILLALICASKRFYRTSSYFKLKTPAYWLLGAFCVLGLVFLLGWFLYHPAWDKASTWGFDRAYNASRTLIAYIVIIIMLFIGWIWSIIKRRQT